MRVSQEVVTLLVKSNTRGAALLHVTVEGKKTVDLPLMKLRSKAWEIGYEDVTHRVLLCWITGGDDHANRQPAIRVIGITAAIVPPQDLVELFDPQDLAELVGSA
jgi:hypothetical protein